MEAVDGIYIAAGSGAVGYICKCLTQMWSARHQKTTVEPSPLPVEMREAYVTRREFDAHVADNSKDHENLFFRMAANDKATARIEGKLDAIQGDVTMIKNNLMHGRNA